MMSATSDKTEATMKNLLRVEELAELLLAIYLFTLLDYAWWWLLVLFLTPDLGMLGYLANTRIGAFTYNLVHHKAVAIGFYLLGALLGNPLLQLIGVILLAHSAFDRAMGYGLKHPDDFKHTHLGWLGSAAKQGAKQEAVA